MSDAQPLTAAVRGFLDRTGMSPITFGRKALNDPHFVRDITAEKPRRVWPETDAKVRAFMQAYPAAQPTSAEAA